MVVGIYKESILVDVFREVTEKLFEAGILQFSDRLQEELAFPIGREEPVDNRRIFSMNDLGFGFQIWLVACGISTTVFVLEVLIFWVPKGKDKVVEFVGSIIVLSILLKWLHNHQ